MSQMWYFDIFNFGRVFIHRIVLIYIVHLNIKTTKTYFYILK